MSSSSMLLAGEIRRAGSITPARPTARSRKKNHRVFIEARRDIVPGEELAYDYNLQIGEHHTKKAKRDHACLCGARRCRGTMLGEDE